MESRLSLACTSIVRHKLGTFPDTSEADARKTALRVLGRDDPAAVPSLGPTLAQAWARYNISQHLKRARPRQIRSATTSFHSGNLTTCTMSAFEL